MTLQTSVAVYSDRIGGRGRRQRWRSIRCCRRATIPTTRDRSNERRLAFVDLKKSVGRVVSAGPNRAMPTRGCPPIVVKELAPPLGASVVKSPPRRILDRLVARPRRKRSCWASDRNRRARTARAPGRRTACQQHGYEEQQERRFPPVVNLENEENAARGAAFGGPGVELYFPMTLLIDLKRKRPRDGASLFFGNYQRRPFWEVLRLRPNVWHCSSRTRPCILHFPSRRSAPPKIARMTSPLPREHVTRMLGRLDKAQCGSRRPPDAIGL